MKLIENIKKEAAILIIFAVLSLLVFMIYHPGASGPYMLDDFVNLKRNTALKMESLSIPSLRNAIFSIDAGPLYRPVSMLSFALNYYFAGNIDGYPIKLLNIVIHIITAWGVFLLSLMLLRRLGTADERGDNSGGSVKWAGIAAVFIAALWLLHPLHVSTVLYTVQRMTALSALFSFYAAIAYVKGRNDLIGGRPAGLWWVLGAVGVGGAFAALSKENGILLPLLLLAIEAAFFRFRFHPGIKKNARYWIYGVLILPSMSIFLYMTGLIFTIPEGLSFRDFTLLERLLTESRTIFYYLRLILLPDITIMGLNHDDFTVSRGFLEPASTLISIIGIGILFFFAVYGVWKNRFPVLSFAILWFLAGHLLESTVVQLELVFEHRNYLPGYGPLFAAGYYVSRAIFVSKRIPEVMRYAVMFVLLMLLAVPLYQRVGQWSLPSKFFMSEIKNHPESARNYAGLAYQQTLVKQYPKVVESYHMAFSLAPYETGYLIAGLDTIVYKMHETPPQELIEMIEKSLRSHKVSPFAALQLFTIAGNSLAMSEGSPQANRAMVERLLMTAVTNPYPWPKDFYLGSVFFNLAEIRFRQNRLEDAASALEKAAMLIPEKYDARLGLARIYMNLNKIEKAEEEIKWLERVRLDPDRQRVLSRLRQELMQRQRS